MPEKAKASAPLLAQLASTLEKDEAQKAELIGRIKVGAEAPVGGRRGGGRLDVVRPFVMAGCCAARKLVSSRACCSTTPAAPPGDA